MRSWFNDSISRLQRFSKSRLKLTWGVAPGYYISRRWPSADCVLTQTLYAWETTGAIKAPLMGHFEPNPLLPRRKRLGYVKLDGGYSSV